MAEGRPIVFNVQGHEFFAYFQGSPQPFSEEMKGGGNDLGVAIVEPAGKPKISLTEAHLDKAGLLVDENQMAVGYASQELAQNHK